SLRGRRSRAGCSAKRSSASTGCSARRASSSRRARSPCSRPPAQPRFHPKRSAARRALQRRAPKLPDFIRTHLPTGERKMIHVIAVITAKPGMREQVLNAFRANVPNVRAEPGCIEDGAAIDYEPVLKFQAALGPDTFMVVEKYQDLDALKAHAGSPHMA